MKRFEAERALIEFEFRRFFSSAWNLRLAVLAVPAVWFALWPHVPSPFVPIFAALFIGLEPLYCNILFRTPHEFDALSVLPLAWKRIVLAKNIATILITLTCLLLLTLFVLYFCPSIPPFSHFWKAGIFFGSVLFPLLHVGNIQSVQHPRRQVGWRLDDLAGGVLVGGVVAALSIPYLLLVEAANSPLLSLTYVAAMGYFWWRRSPGETAHRVTAGRNILCATL